MMLDYWIYHPRNLPYLLSYASTYEIIAYILMLSFMC